MAAADEKAFGTPEQLGAAERDIAAFAEEHPDAYTRLQALWKRHYLEIGHKALGRLLLGKSAADLTARKGGRAG